MSSPTKMNRAHVAEIGKALFLKTALAGRPVELVRVDHKKAVRETIAFAKATTARQLVSHLKNLTTLTYAGAEVDPVHVGNIASVHKVHLPDEWDGVVQLQYQTFLEAQRRMEHAKSRALRKRAMLPSPDYEDDDGGDGSADSDDDDDDFGALEEAVTRPTSGAPAAASASASASASARAIVGRAGAGSGAAAQAASRAGEPADGAAETTPRASAAPAPEDEEAATAMLSTARTATSVTAALSKLVSLGSAGALKDARFALYVAGLKHTSAPELWDDEAVLLMEDLEEFAT